MSFRNTKREKLHMERMECEASRSNNIAFEQLEHFEEHHLKMRELKKKEIENEVFTLTLKGDEARDYNEWKELRGKHKELVQSALLVQAVATLIDKAIESWIERNPMTRDMYTPQMVEDYVRGAYYEASYHLFPLIGRNVFTTEPRTKEETTELINKILGKEQHHESNRNQN